MEECFQSATCVLRACEDFPDVVDLVTLDFEIQALLEFPLCSVGILSAGRVQCVHCVNSLK